MKQTNETKKTYWFDKYQTKTYRGVEYIMYEITPKEAEDKIRSFLDKVGYNLKDYKISVHTEGSKAVLIDLYILDKNLVSDNDIYSKSFIISKDKHNNKYVFRVRHIL